MLIEIKTEYEHYFEDSLGRRQGEFKSFSDGHLEWHWIYLNSNLHGESKCWSAGLLTVNEYYINDELVHNFLENPLTDEERMLLVLKYGGQLLPRGEVC